jgi:hypothetical protein
MMMGMLGKYPEHSLIDEEEPTLLNRKFGAFLLVSIRWEAAKQPKNKLCY